MTANGTGDGGTAPDKQSPVEAVAGVVDNAVNKASPKDVGFFLKMIGVAVLIIALGVAASFALRGSVSVGPLHKDIGAQGNSNIIEQETTVPDGFKGKITKTVDVAPVGK